MPTFTFQLEKSRIRSAYTFVLQLDGRFLGRYKVYLPDGTRLDRDTQLTEAVMKGRLHFDEIG